MMSSCSTFTSHQTNLFDLFTYMDQHMDTTTYKLPIHIHPLFFSAKFFFGECGGCHVKEVIYGIYFCNELRCYTLFHKECAEAPLEINHPSHPQHPLLLTNDSRDGPCDLCGEKLLPPCYSCSTCDFNVDLTCGMKPSPIAIEHPLCHDHPLAYLKKRDEKFHCGVCKQSIGGPSYSCLECSNVYFHVGCVHFSKEVNHPFHSNHPLKLVATDTLTDDKAEKICLLCCEVREGNILYHCYICNFSTCLVCTRKPPPLVIEHTKIHKHPLTRLSKRISYTCDVCGLHGNTAPYICLQCDFVIHSWCIDLARVININRHGHRISFTHHLGAGYSKCGVCHQILSQYHGAYSCSVCPNYAAHVRCAVRNDVWDNVELEGIPEITEDIAPFKVVGDNLICHVSHEKHSLRLHKEDAIHDEGVRCEACLYPVGFDSVYVCEKCCFVLHEKCANLPLKKRFATDTILYTLKVDFTAYVNCDLCRTLSGGFLYTSTWQSRLSLDVLCGSLSEPFIHDGHLHPLYFHKTKGCYCDGCRNHYVNGGYVLRCGACDFDLCFYCACLPEKIWHRNDEHPLTLYCGEKASGKNWCDNCEEELGQCRWFYICFHCRITLHPRCVLGDFSRLKPENIFLYSRKKKRFMAVSNNHNARPLCSWCHSRCKVSIILKDLDEDKGYICSRSCFKNYLG